MVYFAVFARDKPDTAALRAQTRDAHRRHLRETGRHAVSVRFGGPTLTDDGTQMNGTLLIIAAQTIDAVRRFMADDPYMRAGLFETLEIRPWHWSLGNPDTPS